MKKKAETRNMWAAIVKPRRGKEWIICDTLAYTKKCSRTLLLGDTPESSHAGQLERVRFAKVTITEQ